MAVKVVVNQQSPDGSRKEPLIIKTDSFNLKEDYFDFQTGVKTGAHGNSVLGAMIGENHYVRFSDVIDIRVEELVEE